MIWRSRFVRARGRRLADMRFLSHLCEFSNTQPGGVSTPELLEVLQAALHRRQLPAARGARLLLDQVVLDAARRLRRLEDPLPRRGALAERDGIPAARRPVLAVHAPDAARVRVDPRDR